MFIIVLLFLSLPGLQALPIIASKGLQKTSSTYDLPDGFRQRIEDAVPIPGFGEMERRHWLTNEIPADIPAQKKGGGWVRVEEPSAPHLPDGFRQGTEPSMSIPDGFRQGTEPSFRIPDGFRQGTEPFRSIPDGFRQGTEPSFRIPDGFRQGTEPFRSSPDGFRQGTEPSFRIPDGFRQGTEPFRSIPVGFRQETEPFVSTQDGFRKGIEPSFRIPDGFKQGTEPFRSIPDGFRQGTEPSFRIPDGFKQGTEPFRSIPDGFRQGTEPSFRIPDGFRQGTEPFRSIPDGFRQGTEPIFRIPVGFRQGTEPSISRTQTQTVACRGEVISGRCYEFNPTPLAFQDAQELCRAVAENAELASVNGEDLHSRLVSLVTKGGESSPVLTWLGGIVKNRQVSWVDGSEWSYSDWMPSIPNIHTDEPVCMEMFKKNESWWTVADCKLKRASICSYPINV
ncbi:uncharacterized protein [Channa argus]|uniref:uncharacterized protein n=1 Tax=Channa argus TaxID=215402 RepID=UPI0029486BAD|nr:hypothetical protein Q8A73_023009 [Channa argus]